MTNNRNLPTIDQLLESCAIPLDDLFTDDDVAEWCTIATAAYCAPRLDLPTDAVGEPHGRTGKPEKVTAPGIYHSEHEHAAHDLDLAVAVIISTSQAASTLKNMLAGDETIDHSGALVLACLLHLAGDADGAVFWWRFAANEIRQAAFCLELHHRSRAEYRDAEHWRKQSEEVGNDTSPPKEEEHADHTPMARSVRSTLLGHCRRNRRPQLPHSVQEALHHVISSHDVRNPLALSRISNRLTGALY